MSGEIVVGGRRFACSVPVTLWHANSLHFPGLPMRERADLIVLRCTGTDATAAAHHKALQTKRDKDTGKPLGLSCHAFVDHHGNVHQYADFLSRVSGIGNAGNKRSALVDLGNRNDPNRSVRGVTRELVAEVVNGEHSVRTALTAPQMRSTLALIEALCRALEIPYAVPMANGHVIAHALSESALAEFSGVIGIFHTDRRRADPGLYVLRRIAARTLRAEQTRDE